MQTPRIVRSPFKDESEIHALGRCGGCLGCSYRTPCLTLNHTIMIFRIEKLNDREALKHIEAALRPHKERLVTNFLLRICRGAYGSIKQKKEEWFAYLAYLDRACVECGAEVPEDAPTAYKKEQTCCKECYDLVCDAAEEYYYSRCEY